MFSRWGRFIYRRRRPVLLLAILFGIAMATFAGKAAAELSAGGWLDPGSESNAVATRLADDFGAGKGTLVLVYEGPDGGDATSPAFQGAVGRSVEGLEGNSLVDAIVGYAQTGDSRFISTDGRSAYVVVQLDVSDEASVEHLPELEAAIAQPGDGIRLLLGGYGPLTRDSAHQSEQDLVRAETVSLPIAAIILILVFGSLVAAGLPLLVAGLAIPTTLGAVYFVAQATELSIYVQNVSTMLGLALAIDYSLFMVSRFREELAKGRAVSEAVEITVSTAGKAVAFSGFAVAVGLSGLLVFAAPALRSFGIGGALTVLASLLYALTFLPATLGMLGPRVAMLSTGGLVDRVRRALGRPSSADADLLARSRWERLAHWVMRRPVLVLVPTLAVLLIAGLPFFRLVQGIPDAFVLPAGLPSREAAVTLQTDFQPGTTTPIVVLADVAGSPTAEPAVRALAAFGDRLGQVDGVDTVESPFNGLRDPATGAALGVEQLVALYALPREQWPPALGALWDRYVHGSTVRFDAISPEKPASPTGTAVIPRVRGLAAAAPIERIQVGGFAALGEDFLVSQANRIPLAIGITLLAMAGILFLLFGSVVLPIKAIVMTLLSLSASFGALVWIFQEGNFQDVLNFQSPGFTIAGNPIIMFCVLFGLSMDYEVLLLSRMQEAYRRHGDNTEAVAEGLSRTARVITGAALIMVSVFAAFALADTVTIKSIGVGMAIAVLIDATIVRMLLVPATMRLLGNWNWWAPGPLGRFAARLGFSHVEDEPAEAGERAAGAEAPAAT
jgi:uncharacterized membrane protein YdfJ with MMPL/SSD domain